MRERPAIDEIRRRQPRLDDSRCVRPGADDLESEIPPPREGPRERFQEHADAVPGLQAAQEAQREHPRRRPTDEAELARIDPVLGDRHLVRGDAVPGQAVGQGSGDRKDVVGFRLYVRLDRSRGLGVSQRAKANRLLAQRRVHLEHVG